MRRRIFAVLILPAILTLSGCAAPTGPAFGEAPAAQGGAEAQIRELESRIGERDARIKELEDRKKQLESQIKGLEGRLPSEPGPVNLINSKYPPAVGGAPGWKYHKTLSADLDSDGQAEKVSVTTNAEWLPDQREFAWDDGHPWHVYVEEADGSRTYLFSNWVQLGHLEVILDRENPGLYIVASRGGSLLVYRAAYRGPGKAETALAFHIPLSDVATWADPLMFSR